MSSFCSKSHDITISFFFNDTATTEIYTLSLHDALPISNFRSLRSKCPAKRLIRNHPLSPTSVRCGNEDRKSTRLNSSHSSISYAVFCLKKKKQTLKKYTFVLQVRPLVTTPSKIRHTTQS